MRRVLYPFLLCALILAACRAPAAPPATASPAPAMPETATAAPSISATVVVQGGETAQEQPAALEIAPTSAPDPLRFTFPDSGRAPVSAWRPPLYPTPWAPTEFDHFLFSRPIAADQVNWPLADYRYGGVFLEEVVHTGIDIPAPLDTPVLAAGSGRVTWAGYGLYRGEVDVTDPYGLAVAIKHDFGYQGDTLYTVYGHLGRVDVLVGQRVEAGEAVGIVGQTGKVTGPHLHFEVRLGRNNFFVTRNPELWLAPPQGWGILAGRLTDSFGELLSGHVITVIAQSNGQTWTVKTYGKGAAISDAYYQENLTLGDLPAGDYVVWIPFEGGVYNVDVTVSPGMVSYFKFHGQDGVSAGLPATPRPAFTPPVTGTPQPGP